MGEEEIEALHSLLDDKRSKLPPNAAPFLVAPLYAALPAHEQLRAFEPPPRGTRKIILVRVCAHECMSAVLCIGVFVNICGGLFVLHI